MDNWFENTKYALMSRALPLSQLNKTELKEAHHRSKELSTSCDTKGVKFSGKTFQYLYYDSKFVKRGQLIYIIFDSILNDKDCELKYNIKYMINSVVDSNDYLDVISYGGGPGTDISGLVWICKKYFSNVKMRAYLLDYESTWKYYLSVLQDHFFHHELIFIRCDITKPLITSISYDINHYIHSKVEVQNIKLHIFAYVCHETSSKALKGGLKFYRDLAKLAMEGSIFVFMDVQGYSKNIFDRIFNIMKNNCSSIIKYPLGNWYHQIKCEIMILQKTKTKH